MVSKKGIILTAGILVAITIASFSMWYLPQGNEGTIVGSGDPNENLDFIRDVHLTLSEGMEEAFQNLLDENIPTEEYINAAEITSSQVNDLIVQLVQTDIPVEWNESYSNSLESLRNFNSYLRETIVIANMKADEKSQEEINPIIEKAEKYLQSSKDYSDLSDQSRP